MPSGKHGPGKPPENPKNASFSLPGEKQSRQRDVGGCSVSKPTSPDRWTTRSSCFSSRDATLESAQWRTASPMSPGLAPEQMLRAQGFNPDELIATSRALTRRVAPLTRAMPWLTVGPLVFSRSFRAADAETVYPAGDALGFTDPFTGSGMLSAMLTGSMAGNAAALGIPVSHYIRDCRKALGRPFQISAIFRTLLEAGVAPWLAAPIPARWLMQWTRPRTGVIGAAS